MAAVARGGICSTLATRQFTGYKAFRQFRFSVVPPFASSSVVLTKCHKGLAVYSRDLQMTGEASEFLTAFHNLTQDFYNGTSHVLPALSLDLNIWHEPHCLKLARRRRYALLNILFYVPSTFVGTLFDCSGEPSSISDVATRIENKTTQRLLLHYETPQSPSGFFGNPLAPLIADDHTSNWLALQSPWRIVYNVPYLRTPSLWDPRFSALKWYTDIWPSRLTEYSSMAWQEDVDINEHYNYTEAERRIVNDTLLLSEAYVRHNSSDFFRVQDEPPLRRGKHRRLGIRLPLFMLKSHTKSSLKHIKCLQRYWDSLVGLD